MAEQMIEEPEGSAESLGKRKREILVFNSELAGRCLTVDRDRLSGARIAELGGLCGGAGARVLRRLRAGNFEDLRPEEVVDVSEKPPIEFYVGHSDRLYSLDANDLRFDWFEAEAEVEKLMRILGKDPGETALSRIREDGIEEELDLLTKVSFEGDQVERFKTAPAPSLVDVCVNSERVVQLRRGVYTAERLLELLSIPAGHVVNIVLPNGDFNELEPGERVALVRKTEVVSHLPTGGAA